MHFGLNPKYEEDNKILRLYYKGQQSSLASEEVKAKLFNTMLNSLPEATQTGASKEFDKMLTSKKATLGTDSGIKKKNEQDLFNQFFYLMAPQQSTNTYTNRGVVSMGCYVNR